MIQPRFGGGASERLDAPDPRPGTSLGDDHKRPNRPRATRMGPATQFAAQDRAVERLRTKQRPGGRHRDDARHVAVLLIEEGHCARLQRLGGRHLHNVYRQVGTDRGVDSRLHRAAFGDRQGLAVREVEAQPIGRDERPGLMHVFAQLGTQRRVQQVRRRVVRHRPGP